MNYLMMVPVGEITVDAQRREAFGDIQALAESIERIGLLHPIIIDEDKKLVAGERRLRAVRDILKWHLIAARDWGSLTEEERQDIQDEENRKRLDPSSYEWAKDMTRRAPIVAAEIAERVSSTLEETPVRHAGGRPARYDVPKEEVAQALGVGTGTLVRAEQHTETAEAFPFMQGPDWKQSHVLQAGKHLGEVKDERTKDVATKMIQEPFIPPATAVRMLKTLAEMPDEERQRVADLYESEHPQDQSLAKTRLMQRDPMPDPRATVLGRMVKDLRELVRAFPHDPLTPEVAALIDPMKAVVDQINNQHKERLNDSDGAATAAAVIT